MAASLKPSNLLNRRFLRVLIYTVTVLSIGLILLLVANRRRIIHLDEILQPDLLPDYFQPKSRLYIADISIGSCGRLNWKSSLCATPKASEGPYGDVGSEGGWTTLNKDLLLGSSWTTKRYLNVKKISGKHYEANRDKVVVDVALASSDDCNIKGNKLCVPKKVLIEVGEKNKIVGSQNRRRDDKNDAVKAAAVGGSPIDLMRRLSTNSNKKTPENIRVPSAKEFATSGWESKGYGLWIKRGPATDTSIQDLDILFGHDAVEPRIGWTLSDSPLMGLGMAGRPEPRVSVKAGGDHQNPIIDKLQFNKNGRFKILQVADIHFSTGVGKCRDPEPPESAKGCEADPRTLKFINSVLDLEQPDMIALTGDQIFGEAAPDPQTALFKVLMPFIKRKIPYAITVGNHDDESVLSRQEMIELAASLPYSLTEVGAEKVDGFGNYRVDVAGSKSSADAALYFMDSHSYSLDPKNDPGYDYFKQSQLDWIVGSSQELGRLSEAQRLSMAFFHIPLPEYRKTDQPMVGLLKEGVTAPNKNTGMRSALAHAGVQVATCGHDHANDYCLLDTEADETLHENRMWLCYGGGSGEGGYGGYDGYVRRVRVFGLRSNTNSIYTWKRLENDPLKVVDHQMVVKEGVVDQVEDDNQE